jgi:hypothetical protein
VPNWSEGTEDMHGEVGAKIVVTERRRCEGSPTTVAIAWAASAVTKPPSETVATTHNGLMFAANRAPSERASLINVTSRSDQGVDTGEVRHKSSNGIVRISKANR